MEYLILVFVVIGLYSLIRVYNWYYNKKNVGYFDKKLLVLAIGLLVSANAWAAGDKLQQVDCISTLESQVCVGESHDSVIAKLPKEYSRSQKVTQDSYGAVVEREYIYHGKHFFITFGRTALIGPYRVLKIKCKNN